MTYARGLFTCVMLSGALLATPASATAPQKLAPGNVPGPNAQAKAPAADGSLGMAMLGAQVNSDATLFNGSGTTSTSHLGTGLYEVDFNRDVSKCFYSATVFSGGYLILAQPRGGDANGVFVETTDASNGNVDEAFYLTVYCAK